MCWAVLSLSTAQHFKKVKTMDEIQSLKNIIDSKEAEITALRSINNQHRILNGELRKEIDQLKLSNIKDVEDAKKEADKLMMEKIKEYEKKIRRLKNDAKDLLNYP
tara:strand:+ start:100 stop:417 length:318 start_codon:yes stop_codon:yes gene_type:complete